MYINIDSKRGFKYALIATSIAFIIGVIILVLGFITGQQYNKKSKEYIETEAKVVDYAVSNNEEQKNTKAIIVEYVVNDKIYRKQSSIYTSNPKPIGEIIKIKYNPDNPNKMIFPKNEIGFILYLVGGIFAFVGALLTFIFYMVYKTKYKQKETYL